MTKPQQASTVSEQGNISYYTAVLGFLVKMYRPRSIWVTLFQILTGRNFASKPTLLLLRKNLSWHRSSYVCFLLLERQGYMCTVFTLQQENNLLFTLHNLSGDLLFQVPFFSPIVQTNIQYWETYALHKFLGEVQGWEKISSQRDCPTYVWLPQFQGWLMCVKHRTTKHMNTDYTTGEPPSPWSHPHFWLAVVTEKNALCPVLETETTVFQMATKELAGHCTLHLARPPDPWPPPESFSKQLISCHC